MKNLFIKAAIFAAFIFLSTSGYSQVFESTNNETYELIKRYSQKGIIEWNDLLLPLDRFSLKAALEKIKLKAVNLSIVEKKEIDFYLSEYLDEFNNYDSIERKNSFFKKDNSGRFRALGINTKEFILYLDPVMGLGMNKYSNNKLSKNYFNGLKFYGYFGKDKRLGYNFFFREMTEQGDSIDVDKKFNSDQGIINVAKKSNEVNYSTIDFNISYKWSTGFLSIGKDNPTWGYGEQGKIVLSAKAPSFINIRLKYKPLKWFEFDYFHGWLNSNVIDSNLSYPTPNGLREVFTPKFIAFHSVNFFPVKGLSVALGESMIYSDKLDIGYLVPINFFKAYDQYSSSYRLYGGSNNQFFGQISSRNHIPKTHIYGSLFIDEIRLTKILDPIKSRNQIAYTFGFSTTDIILHYLTFGCEYTKVRGGVYNNLIPAQAYTNAGYVMGDWIDQNADRLGFYIKYTPVAKLKINANYQIARKGTPFSIHQQYFEEPEPGFLNDKIFTQKLLQFNIAYEFFHTLKLKCNYSLKKIDYENSTYSVSDMGLGVSYGF